MTQDGVIQSYRGVLCQCCKKPIPLPAIVTKLESESTSTLTDHAPDAKAPVFTLRCRVCDKEYPYSVTNIRNFEGVPTSRLSRVKSAYTARGTVGGLSKAAHA